MCVRACARVYFNLSDTPSRAYFCLSISGYQAAVRRAELTINPILLFIFMHYTHPVSPNIFPHIYSFAINSVIPLCSVCMWVLLIVVIDQIGTST